MSQIVAQFDPSTSNTEEFTAPNSAANGALVFFNESNISLDLNFADGSSMYLPAWYHRHKCGATGSVNIAWDVHQVLSSSSPPISEIIVEAFAQGEHYPADGPLVRQANVGNTVNTAGGSTVFIQDDNRTPGSLTLEATPAGSGSSDASISNQGAGFMAGAWQFLSTIEVDAGINANLMTALTGNDIGFHVASGQRVVDTINSIDTFEVNSSGPKLLAGTIALLVGSISRISVFNQAVTTTLTAYNHNLGAKPDFVIMQLLGTSTTAATGKYDDTTLNSTTVKMISSLNATYRVICIAL